MIQAAAKAWEIDAKKDLWKLPSMYVGQYAEKDAEATLKLWQSITKRIICTRLTDIFKLESRLFPCLVDMRFKGVE